MSSVPSRPKTPPTSDRIAAWSIAFGSESGLAGTTVETTRGVETQGSGSASAERAGPVDPAHYVKNEAADNVKMGRTASEDTPRNSVNCIVVIVSAYLLGSANTMPDVISNSLDTHKYNVPY